MSGPSQEQSSFESLPPPTNWKNRIRRIRFLINRFWWLLVLFSLIGVGIQVVRMFAQPLRYQSVGQMILNGKINLQQEAGVYSEDAAYLFYGTQVTLMKSLDTYHAAVARVQNLHPEVAPDENATLDAFQVPKTSVFQLVGTSTDPEYARLLVDAAMETYLANKRQRKLRVTDTAVAAIKEEITKLDTEINDDEKQLIDFQKENNVIFIEEQSTNEASNLVKLNNELNALKREHDLLTLQIQTGDQTPISSDPQMGSAQQSASAIAAEKQNIDKLTILRDQYGVFLKDKHPKMIALADAIAKEQKFMQILMSNSLEERQNHLKDLQLQIETTQRQLDDSNKKSLELNQRLALFEQLKDKIAREKNVESQFATSIQHVNLDQTMDPDDVITMTNANMATAIDPNYPLQVAIGFGGGLAVGLAFIYLINYLDNRINSPLDLEESFDVPVLGQIPRSKLDRLSKRVPLLTEDDPRHMLGESYRNVRSSLMFRSNEGKDRCKSILITSAIPGEGKSTVAANLAATFAMCGAGTLLIDADLRRGLLKKSFEVELDTGLSEVLQREMHWKDARQQTRLPYLHLLTRGKIPKNAGDLLLGREMKVLIAEALAEYEMVVIDSAPILATDDAAGIMPEVDGVVLVVRTGYSTVDGVQHAIDEIKERQGKIIGVVANAVVPVQPGYRNKYRYSEYNVTADTK